MKPTITLAAAAALAGVAISAQAQLLNDGTFDALTPGTPPDCGVPAGAWQFPPNYVLAGRCEPYPDGFTIVDTSSFDPSRPGRSLHINIANSPSSSGFHLTNILGTPIVPALGQTIRSTWEIFVTQEHSGGTSPLAVYIGADQGGGGFTFPTDVGPRMGWWGDGRLTVNTPAGPTTVVEQYPRNTWQTVQVDIHLDSQTWDLYWAPSGEPLQLLRSNLTFPSGAPSFWRIERWSVSHTDANGSFNSDCYIDNVTLGLPCEPNCDNSTTAPNLNVLDFLCFLNKFAAGDANANCDRSTTPPLLNVLDFACFLNQFAAGCP
jgi:hypothetical protein